MIKRLRLKFGPYPTAAPLEFDSGSLTIFVGPNNSGKSLILLELESLTRMGVEPVRKIIEGIELNPLDPDQARNILLSRAVDPQIGVPDGYIRAARVNPGSANSTEILVNPNEARVAAANDQTLFLLQRLVALFLVRLDGKTRLSLVGQQQSGDLLMRPQNHLAALFQNPDALEIMRDATFDAFGLYFVIDPTNPGSLRVRLSPRKPADPAEEQALDARARRFHQNATEISEFSDGVKAYTGMIAAVLCSDFRVMLVDEPEEFLHPPLIRRLGRSLAELAHTREGTVLASTHSSDFIMGAVQSGAAINIVRLTYRDRIGTATLLASAELQDLMCDPMLRSIGVLSALFHEGAIICEGDQDRAFYQEINERLLFGRAGGADNCIFLNAHNKSTEYRIIRPLRNMGIPAAAVVDVDVLKGEDLKELLHAAFAPQPLINSLGQLKGEIVAAFARQKSDMKHGGIALLDPKDREAAQSLLDQLAKYGIFVVPGGEVQSWLPHLGVKAPKAEWLPAMFARMGSDLKHSDYVHPGDGDVWNFLRKVASWIKDPRRMGMPN